MFSDNRDRIIFRQLQHMQKPRDQRYWTLTVVRSTNQDCGETKPFTFGLSARGLRSWTMYSQGGLSTSRSCALRKLSSMVFGSVEISIVFSDASNVSSFHCSKLKPNNKKQTTTKKRAMM